MPTGFLFIGNFYACATARSCHGLADCAAMWHGQTVLVRATARMDDRHEVEHRMMDRLAEVLWQAQRSGRPPDESAYLRSLRQLER